jgi:hypothetical protein
VSVVALGKFPEVKAEAKAPVLECKNNHNKVTHLK